MVGASGALAIQVSESRSDCVELGNKAYPALAVWVLLPKRMVPLPLGESATSWKVIRICCCNSPRMSRVAAFWASVKGFQSRMSSPV